jgi:serine protease Do
MPRKSSLFYGGLIAISSLVVGMVIASRLDLTPLSTAANGPLTIPETNSAPLEGELTASTFREVAKLASPSVVSIRATTMQQVRSIDPLREFFGFPMPPGRGNRETPEEIPQTGAGSGFIIDKNGYILTNNHVVEGATEIRVRLSTMDELAEGLPARIVGRDELTDTALIQLEELPAEELPVARFGDSSQLAPGDWVMAIGNPFNLSNTVTVGIVSMVGRQVRVLPNRSGDFIQTDAAINQGNSGGPLLNIRGEVVGINSMIYTNARFGAVAGNIGVGFAIPINTVRDLLPQLHEGKVTRGRIGVEIYPNPITEQYAKELNLPRVGGAEVARVLPGGPSEAAGIQAGDVIVEYNGEPVLDDNDLVSRVTATRPGTAVPVKVVRNRETITLNVTVEELDLSAEIASSSGSSPRRGGRAQETNLGMSVAPLTPQLREQYGVPADRNGVVVVSTTPFGPADQARLQEGDVILSVQGTSVSSPAELQAAAADVTSGGIVRLIIWRSSGDGEGAELLIRLRKP